MKASGKMALTRQSVIFSQCNNVNHLDRLTYFFQMARKSLASTARQAASISRFGKRRWGIDDTLQLHFRSVIGKPNGLIGLDQFNDKMHDPASLKINRMQARNRAPPCHLATRLGRCRSAGLIRLATDIDHR